MNGLQFHRDSGKWQFSYETADRAPDDGERRWLASRRANIIFWLKPAGNDRARGAMISLIALMKNRNPDGNANGIAALYVKELAGLPWYGLEQACIAFKRNDVGDGWLPTPGELRQEAGLRAQWAHEEVGTIQTILKAVLPTKRESLAHRAAVAARMGDWMKLPAGESCPPRENYFEPNGEPRSVYLNRPDPKARARRRHEPFDTWGTLGQAASGEAPEKPLPEPGSVVLPKMSGTLQALWDRKAAERGLSEE